ncbi:hypothetical protein LTR66_016633 [Elasticomyces elasticus]|nr:hypothetical protein LTR66_016633 [Elasticomyces elasticus]
MRVLLIRHGETEHNVARLLAGVTDSQLTNHGVNQTQRLGEHLIKKKQLVFSQVFSSDLKRAARTAQAVCDVQNTSQADYGKISSIQLPLIREQDFGSFELLKWARDDEVRAKGLQPTDIDFKPKETKEVMSKRADTFLDDYLLPLLALDEDGLQNIAVVSHGIFLGTLWKALVRRFKPSSIKVLPDAVQGGMNKPLEHLPAWSNTGIVEVEIAATVPAQEVEDEVKKREHSGDKNKLDATMKVIQINGTEHLNNLKRTRGGLGSSASDDKQKRLDGFFKKPKTT